MAKLKLACGTFAILLISFGFSSIFALMALERFYTELLGGSSQNHVLIKQEVSAFIDGQIYVAVPILLGSTLLLLAMLVWRIPSVPEQWSLRNVGWLLFTVSFSAQLLALGLYLSNFLKIAPASEASAASLFDAILEVSATLIIAVLLLVELLILLFKVLQTHQAAKQAQRLAIDPNSMRPAIFLFLFGVDASSSFVPLHMETLYQPLFGLPKDIVLGLPVSAMFLCVSFTIVVGGIWLDRRGWHEPFLTGIALTICAKLYAWLAFDAVHFIAAMCLVGLGYGLSLMASQGFVIVHTNNNNKAQGLAYLYAGMYAGGICGTAVGAMLADRIGYRSVFLLSAIVAGLTLAYTLLAIPRDRNYANQAKSVQTTVPVTARHYWNFLSSRQVLGLIFLSSVPLAIAAVGFLNYFGPVYLDRWGASQSTIGSVLIIYSLCIVYLGPLLSQYIDASNNKRLFIIVGCVLGGCAFLSFYFFSGILAASLTSLLLGLSACFVLASQITYALNLEVSKRLGEGRAVGLFYVSSRIGQMLGPMLFGWLIVAEDINKGVIYCGIGYLIIALLFALVTSEKPIIKPKLAPSR